MNNRLILKQQQESQVESLSDGDLSTHTLLTTLGCSGILALNYFTQTGQLWISSFAYLASLATVAGIACQTKSHLALSEGSLNSHSTSPGLQDERAQQTATTPLLSAQHQENSRTRIKYKSPQLLAIEPRLQAHYLGFGIALIVGMSVAMMLLADWLQLTNSGWFARLKAIPPDVQTALVLLGLVVVAVIINQLRKPACRVLFDKTSGVFWLEHILIFNFKARVSAQMPIAHIIALQNLDTTNRSDDGKNGEPSLMPFHTRCNREVNIVFRNTERVNLLHANVERALGKDIKQLADFLDVPVWSQEKSFPIE